MVRNRDLNDADRPGIGRLDFEIRGDEMHEDACTLPAREGDDEFEMIKRMLGAKRIAVIGLSDRPHRASFHVASYLLSAGKEIVPVHPRHESVLGLKCYASLEDVPGKIDLVDVFRRAEYCPDVVRSAIKVGAQAIWLQSGIVSDESRLLARKAGLDYVEDRCLMVEHMHAAH